MSVFDTAGRRLGRNGGRRQRSKFYGKRFSKKTIRHRNTLNAPLDGVEWHGLNVSRIRDWRPVERKSVPRLGSTADQITNSPTLGQEDWRGRKSWGRLSWGRYFNRIPHRPPSLQHFLTGQR